MGIIFSTLAYFFNLNPPPLQPNSVQISHDTNTNHNNAEIIQDSNPVSQLTPKNVIKKHNILSSVSEENNQPQIVKVFQLHRPISNKLASTLKYIFLPPSRKPLHISKVECKATDF